MEYLLFTLYFCVLCFAVTKTAFVKKSAWGSNTIVLLFCIKIAAGIAVGLVSHYIFNDLTDYYITNVYGMEEHHSLLNTPHTFFTDLFTSNYKDKGAFFGTAGSYWNDLRFNIIYKILAFTNFLSRGSYYINSLFFNTVGFIATVALYRVFSTVYPTKKWLIVVGCFLLPSTLFYSSGIHKELIIFAALSVFCYSLYFSLEKKFTATKICLLLLSFLFILIIRNFIAVILLPCALAWFISKKYSIQPHKVFGILFLTGAIATTLLHTILKKADPLLIVVNRQQAFFALGKAHTDYQLDSLQPTIKSFVAIAPEALRHAFLSPLPNEFNNIFTNLLSVEIILYWLLFLLMIMFPLKNKFTDAEFITFGLVFAFLIFLFTGYISPNAGALVRYRSIYFPFLVIPLLCKINWEGIKSLIPTLLRGRRK